jgi:hypothetical protein
LFFLLKRTFLTLLRDLRLDPLRLDLLRLRLLPPRIAIALEDDKGEGVGFSATPVIFFFRLPNDSVIVSNIPIYILYFYLKHTF